MKLHEYRCETCDNYIPQQCMNGEPQCKIAEQYFDSDCETLISKVGCASYSNHVIPTLSQFEFLLSRVEHVTTIGKPEIIINDWIIEDDDLNEGCDSSST